MSEKKKDVVGGQSIYVETAEDRDQIRKDLKEKRRKALSKIKNITNKIKKENS